MDSFQFIVREKDGQSPILIRLGKPLVCEEIFFLRGFADFLADREGDASRVFGFCGNDAIGRPLIDQGVPRLNRIVIGFARSGDFLLGVGVLLHRGLDIRMGAEVRIGF